VVVHYQLTVEKYANVARDLSFCTVSCVGFANTCALQ